MIEAIEALRKDLNPKDRLWDQRFDEGLNVGIERALVVVREALDAAPTVTVEEEGDVILMVDGPYECGMEGCEAITVPSAGTYRLLKEAQS
jgi:hypothetical protein